MKPESGQRRRKARLWNGSRGGADELRDAPTLRRVRKAASQGECRDEPEEVRIARTNGLGCGFAERSDRPGGIR